MRIIQLSHKSRTNGSATFQTVQTVGRPLLPGRPMTLCQVDEHTSRDYATSHSWCATHSLSKRPSFSAWWLLAPWQWSSPLGSLLVLFRFYTWFLDLFLCTAENLWKFWHSDKRTIPFSINEMGIDIISLLHCISITSISQVYCMSLIGVSVPIHSKTWKVSVPNGNSTTPPIIKTLAQNLSLIGTQC